jgi:uncharacterized protein VirK/YbjX
LLDYLILLEGEPMLHKYIDFGHKLSFFIQHRRGWGTSSGYAFHLNYCRRLVFIIQSLANHKLMAELLDFFMTNSLRRDIVNTNTCILEQAVRRWFYYDSTMQERIALLKECFLFFESKFSKEALQHIYFGEGIPLWSQEYKHDTLSLILHFNRSHRKEGLMTVTLTMGGKKIYLVTFWIASDIKGQKALWIGAFQGSKGDLQTNRDLTKHFFGYRPKNLMIYVLRTIAQQLQLEEIYAVSNHGFQASHHISSKRRLKTSLDDFWKETQGEVCSDSRFFTLPLIELRKSLEEVVSHKRNLYRKRFAMLDSIDADVREALKPYLIEESLMSIKNFI